MFSETKLDDIKALDDESHLVFNAGCLSSENTPTKMNTIIQATEINSRISSNNSIDSRFDFVNLVGIIIHSNERLFWIKTANTH